MSKIVGPIVIAVALLTAFYAGQLTERSQIIYCDPEYIEPMFYGEIFQCVNNGRLIGLAD